MLLAAAALTSVLSLPVNTPLPPMPQVRCLASNIYHEARGEPLAGRVAVAEVTLNRVKSEGFPDTICGVVHERAGSTCAFSWVCSRIGDIEHKAYQEALWLAELVLLHQETLPHVAHGATHYYKSGTRKPRWASKLKEVASVGSHLFFR